MLSVKRILRDYEDAGSVNSLISLWGFVDDAAFLTKAGHVGIAYRLRGIDYEGLTHAQSAAIVHRLEAALRLLDEHWHVYQYVVKRTIPPVSAATCSQPAANEAIQERFSYLNGRRSELFEVRLFVVLLYEAPTSARTSTSIRDLWKSPLAGLKNWLSPEGRTTRIKHEKDVAWGSGARSGFHRFVCAGPSEYPAKTDRNTRCEPVARHLAAHLRRDVP